MDNDLVDVYLCNELYNCITDVMIFGDVQNHLNAENDVLNF